MKKILITGANSYIGTSFEKWLSQWKDEYQVDTLDMQNNDWKAISFSGYDVVYHVAGIAHSDNGKITKEKEKVYRSINTDLTIETAKKSKNDGVKQFIFMSSAIIYGNSAPIGKRKIITKDTEPRPANCYGDSKLQAENGLHLLEDEIFKVCVLRPPMVYGKGSKGNYQTLSKMAKKLPFFPKVNNQRSMLYIDNLCQFVKLMIDNNESGTFFPQNAEYTNTSEMVKMIAAVRGKKIKLTKIFNWALYCLRPFTKLVDKAFGSLVYDQEMSKYKEQYDNFTLLESVEKTEG